MLSSIKKLFLLVLTPLLCIGSSFAVNVGGNAGSYISNVNFCQQNGFIYDVSSYDLVCFVPQYGSEFRFLRMFQAYDDNYNTLFYANATDVIQSISPFCFLTNNADLIYFNFNLGSPGDQQCQQNMVDEFYANIYGYSLGGGNSSCESDLEYLSGKYAILDSSYISLSSSYSALSGNYANCLEAKNILSGSLASCNSDLASCSNGCDALVSSCLNDKDLIQASYSGCLSDNSSLQNYNDALSDQLTECLSSSGSLGSGSLISLFDVFWDDNNTSFSLPITNNIRLPEGYKGFIDEGVLGIKKIPSLETAYSISDEDFNTNVIGNFGVVFLFLISSGFFLIFLYTIRKYFIGLKS